MNPLQAVGLVVRVASPGPDVRLVELGGGDRFLGSCFAIRQAEKFLTAAHSVKGQELDKLYVVCAADRQLYRVGAIETHPRADVAIITLTSVPPMEPFWNAVPPHGLGEDLFAYGFPEETHPVVGPVPTPRLFKGHIQRVIPNHKSFMGYEYPAFELSMACPGGLSGGPCFRPPAPTMVVGMATENVDSTTILDAFEETTSESQKTTTKYQRVITYGVALNLSAVTDWLDTCVPPRRPLK